MDSNKEKAKILFLCTGNTCRSQMAEGWAKDLKSDVIDAYSAGVCPAGVSTKVIQVMAEAGVDISSYVSKHVYIYLGTDFDFIITLCDYAKSQCPTFGGKTKLVHRAFKDPISATGSEEQILDAFRKTRDEIRAFVETLPESVMTGADTK
ncbi:arsenate reductase ArsC [Planctomycetota bacterium]